MANEQTVSSHLGGANLKKPRSSNLELYRIVCMLMIVAHHYVINSGVGKALLADPSSANSIFMALFGAWGKTGINCFLMITGYYMCTSKITFRKFIKLLGQIYLYKFLLYPLLLVAGYESLSIQRITTLIMPFWGFNNDFVSCFIVFWLFIPFLTKLVQSINKREHELLLLLTLGSYTLLGTIPTFQVVYNYITWFCIIFIVASYIRLYPRKLFENKTVWGWITVASVLLSLLVTAFMHIHFCSLGNMAFSHYFLCDCNKFFAVVVAVSSFLWFKNIKIKYNKVINAIGAGTFGVLLIHANSPAMRTWLWKNTIDVVGHYSLPFGELVLFSLGVVLAVFTVCNLIDQLRIYTIEKWFFDWYDQKMTIKADRIISRITTSE